MSKYVAAFLSLFAISYATTPKAASVELFELGLYVNGSVQSFTTPGDVACGGCVVNLDNSGIGSISFTLSGAGSNRIGLFVDYEIDETVNTFYNEFGEVSGSAPVGLSWEIDEPGYVFGDIYSNFIAGGLDNTNTVPAAAPEDVSMALMWDFVLGANQSASLIFNIGLTQPASPFWLAHRDADSADGALFLSTSLTIQNTSNPPVNNVPEPSILWLMLSGVLALRKHKQSAFRPSRWFKN
ncbi:PEP-CTERM sorting domain-containing protein [Methylomonas koyamae]|uniref:PEP-CTERM protein-sorting domain-containing protein n=1 Tax=Methylomonas koyamae TaxID=702114 RepID=A0AA91D9K1_9GAMM|nr:PEP-CTERM sorting domain-containing protein [Methylomonas koyamae]OAI22505.1 hypothetical protein A1356_19170 [Methylomonas koyamae]